MKLKIETWLDQENLSLNARHLLSTGITCYKAEANTAALLMSYLGFLVILKNRIMTANKPPNFEQGNWDKLLKDMRNEDSWEANVFDATQTRVKIDQTTKEVKRDPIFAISESLREQIKYWKNRRNDCAHNKDNEISNAHVETFWSFMMSNLPKITVEGGFASLVNKIEKHYDSSFTSSKQDVAPLIQEIANAVERNELPDFWPKALQAIDDASFDWEQINRNDFIHKVFVNNNLQNVETLIGFIKSEEGLRNSFIMVHPEIIQRLSLSEQENRNFWKTKLISFNEPLKVYASMLRNNLILPGEIEEANTLFSYKKIYTDDLTDHLTLSHFGFGKALHKVIFVDNDPTDLYHYWKFLHSNAKFVRQYLQYYPLTADVVKIISSELNKDEFYPFFLQNELETLFKGNPSKKDEFLKIISENGFPIPKQLSSLQS